MSHHDISAYRPFKPPWPTVAGSLRGLAHAVARRAADYVVRRVARRAHRELRALDDRVLEEIGLDRARLAALLRGMRVRDRQYAE